MRHLSVKIPELLYQKLEKKAENMGNLNLSEALRILLCAAVDNPNLESVSHYDIKTYALLNEAILSLVAESDTLISRAQQQAQQLIATIAQDPAQ